MKKNLLYVISLLVFIFSCSPETEVVPQVNEVKSGTPKFLQLKEIRTTQGKIVTKYVYDKANRIIETQDLDYYNRFYYDVKGALIKKEGAIHPNLYSSFYSRENTDLMTAANTTITNYTLYEYNAAGLLIATKNFQLQNNRSVYTSRQSFEYNKDKITEVNLYDATNKLTQSTTYTYDHSGNVAQEDYYSYQEFGTGATAQLLHRKIYQYDTKNNPYQIYNVLGIPGLYTNPNNIIKVNTTSFANTPGVPENDLTETLYKYNQAHFPVQVDGTYEYIYH